MSLQLACALSGQLRSFVNAAGPLWDLISRSVGPCLPTLRARAPGPQKQKQTARSAGKFAGYPSLLMKLLTRLLHTAPPVCASGRVAQNSFLCARDCQAGQLLGKCTVSSFRIFGSDFTTLTRPRYRPPPKQTAGYTIVEMCVFVPKIENRPPSPL